VGLALEMDGIPGSSAPGRRPAASANERFG
jgi:hypothetical protein